MRLEIKQLGEDESSADALASGSSDKDPDTKEDEKEVHWASANILESRKRATAARNWETIKLPAGWTLRKSGKSKNFEYGGQNVGCTNPGLFLARAFEVNGEVHMKKWCEENDFQSEDIDKARSMRRRQRVLNLDVQIDGLGRLLRTAAYWPAISERAEWRLVRKPVSATALLDAENVERDITQAARAKAFLLEDLAKSRFSLLQTAKISNRDRIPPQPRGLVVPLTDYQLDSFAWMLGREGRDKTGGLLVSSPISARPGSCAAGRGGGGAEQQGAGNTTFRSVQTVERRVGGCTDLVFQYRLERTHKACGGILAHKVGYGKTAMVIALVRATVAHPFWPEERAASSGPPLEDQSGGGSLLGDEDDDLLADDDPPAKRKRVAAGAPALPGSSGGGGAAASSSAAVTGGKISSGGAAASSSVGAVRGPPKPSPKAAAGAAKKKPSPKAKQKPVLKQTQKGGAAAKKAKSTVPVWSSKEDKKGTKKVFMVSKLSATLPEGEELPDAGTLVLCPVNVAKQWEREIAKFTGTGPGSLRTLLLQEDKKPISVGSLKLNLEMSSEQASKDQGIISPLNPATEERDEQAEMDSGGEEAFLGLGGGAAASSSAQELPTKKKSAKATEAGEKVTAAWSKTAAHGSVDSAGGPHIVIVPEDAFATHFRSLKKVRWQRVVVDEVHKLQSSGSNAEGGKKSQSCPDQTRNLIAQLRRSASWGLTGTPNLSSGTKVSVLAELQCVFVPPDQWRECQSFLDVFARADSWPIEKLKVVEKQVVVTPTRAEKMLYLAKKKWLEAQGGEEWEVEQELLEVCSHFSPYDLESVPSCSAAVAKTLQDQKAELAKEKDLLMDQKDLLKEKDLLMDLLQKDISTGTSQLDDLRKDNFANLSRVEELAGKLSFVGRRVVSILEAQNQKIERLETAIRYLENVVAALKGSAKKKDGDVAMGSSEPDSPDGEDGGGPLGDWSECPICLSEDLERTEVSVTACGHVACTDCFGELFKMHRGETSCPTCRAPISADKVDVLGAVEFCEEQEEQKELDGAKFGSKIAQIVAEIKRVREEDPKGKIVLWVQWKSLMKKVGVNGNR